jgi:hypothetical protein
MLCLAKKNAAVGFVLFTSVLFFCLFEAASFDVAT